MANFGHRSAILFWIISLLTQIAFLWGWTTWSFLAVWGLVGVVEKSYKMISDETEEAFLTWADNVWDSMTNFRGNHGNHGLP